LYCSKDTVKTIDSGKIAADSATIKEQLSLYKINQSPTGDIITNS